MSQDIDYRARETVVARRGLLLRMLAASALLCLGVATRATAATETRNVDPFEAIAMNGAATLDVKIGADQSVILEGDGDALAHVTTEVRDNTLVISEHDAGPHSLNFAAIKIHITVPHLSALTFNGSGHTTLSGLDGGTTRLTLSGSGSLGGTGHLDKLVVAINGSGHANLADLSTGDAGVTINGAGDATVQPHQSLAATINGSGDIIYVSAPTRVTTTIHGSGIIRQR